MMASVLKTVLTLELNNLTFQVKLQVRNVFSVE